MTAVATTPVPSFSVTVRPGSPGSPASCRPLPLRSCHRRSPTVAIEEEELPEPPPQDTVPRMATAVAQGWNSFMSRVFVC